MSRPEGWDQLQQDYPEHAERIKELARGFGKHTAAAVKANNEIVFRVGRFDQAKNLKFVSQYKGRKNERR